MVGEAEGPERRMLRIELTPSELELVRVGLKLLLDAERDVELITEVKALLARLPRA